MKRRQILSGLFYGANAHSELMGIIESICLWNHSRDRLHTRNVAASSLFDFFFYTKKSTDLFNTVRNIKIYETTIIAVHAEEMVVTHRIKTSI